MSRHNRERKLLWKLGLTRKQKRRKLLVDTAAGRVIADEFFRRLATPGAFQVTHDEIRAAKAAHPLFQPRKVSR